METLDKNQLESILAVLVTEQCRSGTSALFSNHKNDFKFIFLNNFILEGYNS